MRVAIVSESFLPQVNGVSNTVRHVANQLVRLGHEPLVIAPGPGPRTTTGCRWCGCGRWGCPATSPSRSACRRAVERAIARLPAGLVHSASPICLGAVGLRVARGAGPTVAVYQTDIAGFARQYGSRPTWSWTRWVGRLHRGCDSDAGAVADVVRPARGARRTRTCTCGARGLARPVRPGPPRPRAARSGPAAATSSSGTSAGSRPRRRYAGWSGPAQVPGIRLVDRSATDPSVAGSRSGCRRDLHRHARRRRSGAWRSRRSTCSCTRGTSETFCQTVQEAQASGVPVVAAAAGGLLDLVDPGETGLLFDPARPGVAGRRRRDLRRQTAVLRDRVAAHRAAGPSPPAPGTHVVRRARERPLPATGRAAAATTRRPHERPDRPARQLRRPGLGRDEDRGGAARARVRRGRSPAPAGDPGPPRPAHRDRVRRRRPGPRTPGRRRLPADRRAVAGDRRARAVRADVAGDLRQVDAAARRPLGAEERRRHHPVLPRAARRDALAAHRPAERHRRPGRGDQPRPGPPVRPGRRHVAVRDARVPPGRRSGRDRRPPDPARRRPGHLPTPRGARRAIRRPAPGPRGPALPREESAPGRGHRRRPAPARRTACGSTCTAPARTATSSRRSPATHR